MIKYDVLNRFTGDVQFTAEIDCDEKASESLKLGLAVKWAVKNKANLQGANLEGANLRGARGNCVEVKSLHLDEYDIAYTSEVMQIGCERHKISDWWAFDDDRIDSMDDRALEWWRKWKPILQNIIEASPAVPTGYKEQGDESLLQRV